MYNEITMPNIINLSEARSNLSQVIEDVFTRNKTYILIRASKPQAVIIPYEDFEEKKEERWQDELDELMKEGRKTFSKYLKENNIKPPKNEEEVYEIIDKVAGRHRH